MQVYVALLRGINVGGNSLIKMAELKICLQESGLENVSTYIQSGNIIFTSKKSEAELSRIINSAILKKFSLNISVVVISLPAYENIIKNVPAGWGEDSEWKYNLLFLLPPYNAEAALKSIGDLKPEIEAIATGTGVLYQSVSFKLFGRSRSGKLASMPIYKQMTVRNHRTGNKLLELMKAF